MSESPPPSYSRRDDSSSLGQSDGDHLLPPAYSETATRVPLGEPTPIYCATQAYSAEHIAAIEDHLRDRTDASLSFLSCQDLPLTFESNNDIITPFRRTFKSEPLARPGEYMTTTMEMRVTAALITAPHVDYDDWERSLRKYKPEDAFKTFATRHTGGPHQEAALTPVTNGQTVAVLTIPKNTTLEGTNCRTPLTCGTGRPVFSANAMESFHDLSMPGVLTVLFPDGVIVRERCLWNAYLDEEGFW